MLGFGNLPQVGFSLLAVRVPRSGDLLVPPLNKDGNVEGGISHRLRKNRDVGTYRPAAVCKRGHLITDDITRHPEVGKRCTKCGAPVLVACPECNARIRGEYHVEGVAILGGKAAPPPNFCDDCGAAFPWVNRQGRIYELQNRIDDEDLDPASELIVREQLEALLDSDIADEEAARRWGKIKELAPGLWEKSGARTIIESLATAYIRAHVGF